MEVLKLCVVLGVQTFNGACRSGRGTGTPIDQNRKWLDRMANYGEQRIWMKRCGATYKKGD